MAFAREARLEAVRARTSRVVFGRADVRRQVGYRRRSCRGVWSRWSPARRHGAQSPEAATRIAGRSWPLAFLSRPTVAGDPGRVPISQGSRATAALDQCLCDLDERSCPAPTASGRDVPQCQIDLGLPHPTLHCRRWPPKSRAAGCGQLHALWPSATSHGRWVQVGVPTQASADLSLLRSDPSGQRGDRQRPNRTWPVQSQLTPNPKPQTRASGQSE